ncbi:MAG: Major outer membrane porin [Chlamydiae bacterium]|nr:Major outer membrane porin [Chlamydiota bacterium]
MKRLIVLGLALLASGVAYALPLGNPSEASLMHDGVFYEPRCVDFCDPYADWSDAIFFRLGFYGDYVLNRNLEVYTGIHKGKSIEQFELTTNAGEFTISACDRVDLFVVLGTTNIDLTTNAASLAGAGSGAINGDRLHLESETRLSLSFGGRATLFQSGCCSFGIEGQYFYTKPDIRRITARETVSVNPAGNIQMKYSEWQIGFGVSYRIWNLVPYFGGKWSSADVDLNHAFINVSSDAPVVNVILDNFKNRFNGGYVIGVSLVNCEKATLTFETRYPDEKAFFFNVQFRL